MSPSGMPKTAAQEIQFRPARILLQDFTGVPCVVDLAAMRDALKKLGAESGAGESADPGRPGDRPFGAGGCVRHCGGLRSRMRCWNSHAIRSAMRFCAGDRRPSAIFAWSRPIPASFTRSTEYLASVVFSDSSKGVLQAYPDTLMGTDSHTTMINGVGVVGWGVGGIEAEACMLGQPISMLLAASGRLQIERQAAGRRDRNRSGLDRHADAAQERRGRKIRRVLRPRRQRSARWPTAPPSATWLPNTAPPSASSRSMT